MCPTRRQEVLLWPISTAVYSLLNPAACLPSVLRSALRLTVPRHFSALLMQRRDADKGDDCSFWQWRHAGRPSPSQGFIFRMLCHMLNNPQSQRWHSYCGHLEYIYYDGGLEIACHTIIQNLMSF